MKMYKLCNGLMATTVIMAAMLLASCSYNEMVTPVSSTVQVELSAQIKQGKGGKSPSRTMTRVVGNQWELNDIVGIFMIADGGELPGALITNPYTNNNNKYDNCRYKIVEGPGSSEFKLSAVAQEDMMYYPENRVDFVDFIAYYPYLSTLNNYHYPLDVRTQDGTKNHDLLYSTDGTGSAGSPTGNITFEHQLSKLQVKLKPLMSTIDFTSMVGVLKNVPVTGKFSLINKDIITDTNKGNIISSVSYTEDSGLDYTAENGTGDIIYTCFDFILIPHGEMANRELSFSTSSKRYYWRLPDDRVFEPGKEYEVVLEVDGNVSNPMNLVSYIIRPWGEGGPTISLETEKIPAGTFWMGSPGEETLIAWGGEDIVIEADPLKNIDGREEPMHVVTIEEDFYMSKYEITTTEYCSFLNANSGKITIQGSSPNRSARGKLSDLNPDHDYSSFADDAVLLVTENVWGITYSSNKWSPQIGYENHPVNNVTWFGALAFAHWAGGRLPTEAEWEYACRGGDYFFGNTAYRWASYNEITLGDYAWYLANNSTTNGTKAVGLKLPNAWGLYDMHGNVREWCYDWYNETFYGTEENVSNPVNTVAGDNKVVRGGDYDDAAIWLRSACRLNNPPTVTNAQYGFRVVFPLE